MVLPGGEGVRVDLLVGAVDDAERAAITLHPAGDLSNPRRRHERVQAAVVVASGQAVIIAADDESATQRRRGDTADAGAGCAVLVRARVLDAIAPAADAGAKLPARFDVGSLIASFRTRRLETARPDSPHSPRPPVPSADAPIALESLERRLDALLPPDELDDEDDETLPFLLDGSLLFADVDPDVEKLVGQRLAELAAERLRMVAIDLWQGLVDDDAARERGTVLDDAWLGRFADAGGRRTRLVSIIGSRPSLARVESRRYLREIEKVSGGTGYVIENVFEPIFATAGAGLVLNARCRGVSGFEWVQLDVDAARVGAVSFDRRIPSSLADTTRGADRRLSIELAEERDSETWRHAITVPLGKPVLLSALPAGDEPGKTRVLIATLRLVE